MHALIRVVLSAVALLGLSLPSATYATYITPTSYTLVGTVPGDPYGDESGKSLIDGILAPSYTFWNHPADDAWAIYGYPAQLTFNFAQNVTIERVELDITVNNANAVFVPNITIGTSFFALPADAILDNARGWIGVDGFWSGSSLTVTLSRPNGGRSLVDEFRFTAAPDAGCTLTLLGGALGLLGLFGWRNRK